MAEAPAAENRVDAWANPSCAPSIGSGVARHRVEHQSCGNCAVRRRVRGLRADSTKWLLA